MNLTELERDALAEVLNVGVGQAANALSQLSGHEVMLSVPVVHMMTKGAIAEQLGQHGADRVCAVRQEFAGVLSTEAVLMVVAIALAFAGIALAWMRYGRSDRSAAPQGALQKLVASGYQLDAIYERVFVRGLGWLSISVLSRRIENPLSAGSTQAPAVGARAGARLLARLQTGHLQAYVIYALLGLVAVLAWGASRG